MEAVGEKPRRRGLRLAPKIVLFFAVFGPGLITASADNDVGGITVYSQAGAQFGYAILWTLIPITIALMVVQEMSARMGAVTGKGLAGLIREHFGVRWTFFVMVAFVASNVFTTAAEFAGVAVAAQIFHLPIYLIIPAVAFLVFFLVLRTDRGVAEKVFLVFSALYFTYVISGFRAHPDWHEVWRGFLIPSFSHDQNYLWMIIALIGTTISPWMQFYIQSSIVEKGIRVRDYAFSRIDVLFGCFVTDFMSFFMILATAATIFVFNVAHPHHQYTINETRDAAKALEPIAGQFATMLFGFGLLNAGIFTASILPLSTAFFVCEAGGFESGVGKRFSEAPTFFSLYAGVIFVGALLVLIPGIPLLKLINYSQIASGILLPFLLIFMLILINKKPLMGNYRNGPVFNTIAWGTALIVGAITLLSVYQTIAQTFFSS